jgi:hypothetical protein
VTGAATAARFAVVNVAVMLVALLPVLASTVPPAAPSYTLWVTVYLAVQYTIAPGFRVATVPAPLVLQLKVPQVLSELRVIALARWLPVLLMLMLTVTSVSAAQQQHSTAQRQHSMVSLVDCGGRHGSVAVQH